MAFLGKRLGYKEEDGNFTSSSEDLNEGGSDWSDKESDSDGASNDQE